MVGSPDNSLCVWTLDPDELLRVARDRAGVRPLSDDDRRRYADLLGEDAPRER